MDWEVEKDWLVESFEESARELDDNQIDVLSEKNNLQAKLIKSLRGAIIKLKKRVKTLEVNNVMGKKTLDHREKTIDGIVKLLQKLDTKGPDKAESQRRQILAYIREMMR